MPCLKRISKGILITILCLGLVFPVGATDLKDNELKKDELEQELNQAEQEAATLEEQLDGIVNDMRRTKSKMEAKEAEIEEAENALILAHVSRNEQYAQMKSRIKYMYENGNRQIVEVLLESESIADFINRAEYATMLSDYDRDMLRKYQDTVNAIEQEEVRLKDEYDALGKLQKNLSKKQKRVETLLQEQDAEVARLASEIDDLQALIDEAREAERRRQEAEKAQQQSSNKDKKPNKPSRPNVSGNGRFTHPCPGMTYQSSYFGEVRYGIGDLTPHKGHDYAAPSGTPIYAAAEGTVVIAGYSNSAGYWVVIDHGKGLTTKYMHVYARPYVSAGEKVVKGQHIGGVGTTGQSTGNHLHFQVEEYGVAVNPDKYM